MLIGINNKINYILKKNDKLWRLILMLLLKSTYFLFYNQQLQYTTIQDLRDFYINRQISMLI